MLYSPEDLRDGNVISCPYCGGHGKIYIPIGSEGMRREETCKECGGCKIVRIRLEKIE